MEEKLLLKLTAAQRQLLLDYQHYIVDADIVRSISVGIKEKNKYNIYLTDEEFDLLIGYVCGIANHEEDEKVAEKFSRLSDYLEDCYEQYD